MPDLLLDDIDQALLRPLDEREFERCANFALGPLHPTLVPVEGGNDLGQDGIALDEELARIVLVVTSGKDVIGNLRKNLKRHREAGGPARHAIVATNQKLSATRIKHLEDAAKEEGFELVHTYTHGFFHRYLYSDGEWRLRLLHISGAPPALSAYPLSRRAQRDVPLVGRDDVRSLLAELDTDLVIYGEPGSGKTSLLASLVDEGEWGRFAIDDDPERLAEALREFRPPRVIVDDAHLRPEWLETLVHLRRELALEFAIIATSWAGWTPDVATFLPSPKAVTLEPLTREEILQVIEAIGLRGNARLQISIINQALGRPGLAATLTAAILAGRTQDVWMGDAILADAAGTVAGQLGSPEDLTALGVLALSDDDGLLPSQLATLIGEGRLWVNGFLRRVATGGLIESIHGTSDEQAIRVQPAALRFALAFETFGSERSYLSAADVVSRMPSPASAAMPLIYSLHRGARRLAPLVRDLVATGTVEPAALAAYASLGANEAREALAVAPDRRVAEIAVEAADIAPEVAIPVLLSLAVGDDRPRHSHPEHAMRQLGDFVREDRNPLERRRAVGAEVRKWVKAGGEPATAAEALCLILSPSIGGVEPVPGSGLAYSFWTGGAPWESLEPLLEFWDDLISLAEDPRTPVAGPIINLVGDWLYPGRALLGGGSAPDAWHEQVRATGERVARDLAVVLADRPGQLQLLRRTAGRAGLDLPQRPPPDFAACYPEREFPDGDYSAEKHTQLEQEWTRNAEHLADEWLGLPVPSVADRLAWIEREARAAGFTYPKLSPQVVSRYAANCPSALTALRRFAAAGVPSDIQQPLVAQLFEARRRPSDATLLSLLDDPLTSEAAAWVCLHRPVSERVLGRVIERAEGWPVWGHDGGVFAVSRMTPAAQLGLLRSRSRAARRTLVLSLAADRPPGMPPELDTAWREEVPRTPAGWWLEEALLQDPDLLVAWTKGWAERTEDPDEEFESFPDRLLPALEDLPLEARRELLREVMPRRSILTDEVVARLVSDDLETVEILFSEGHSRFLHAALAGEIDESWIRRATIAHRAGWSPARIVAAQITGVGVIGFSGPESNFWETKAQRFRDLLATGPSGLERELWEASLRLCEADRDRARERERREDIYGRD